MRTVPVTLVAEPPPTAAADGLIDVSVSCGGEVDALLIDTLLDYRSGAQGEYPKALADRPNRFRILCDLAGSPWEISPPELRDNLHFARRVGADRWLLVRGRCEEPDDRNAIVIDGSGEISHRFHIGDAVQDVQVTPRWDIWVGYFDEAYGGATAGAAGLAAFDLSGKRLFDFNGRRPVPIRASGETEPLPEIVDCYAFNAASDREVWVCPYTDFPVIRLLDGRIDRVWPNPGVEGAHAMVGFGDRVLFAGAYGDRGALFLCDLDRPKQRPRRLIAVDPSGAEVACARAFAAGRRMYMLTERGLFRVELQALTEGLR